MYLRCFKLYLPYFISFSSSQDCIEVQEKKKKVAVLCFRPPQKKCIFTSTERELHVSTSYEFLSFSEPISQDFYPQPTSIDKQSVSSVKLTRNQTRVRSTTQCQLFFFFTRLNWLSTYRDSRLPPVYLSYICHVFALVSGNPLARQAHSLLWF